MSDKTESKMQPIAIDENEALKILEGFAAKNEIIVPFVVNGQMLHEGIKFNVPLERYNKFLNDSQSGKQSMTATAKNFLIDIVDKEHKAFLIKSLQVKGVLNYFMERVTSEAQPNFGETLD
ncbi:hypothetical protein MW332_004647 [Vibrio parahaemolyticus]|uniref:putative phage tail assembly chaperone n=1 Tax=Vibrio parahaemolyticus TaxID=670 RepID=UPI0015E0EC24|nr:putative phage tail assembly chaperone [Vibrio parahaemolyticus]EJB8454804.1 hypothetical protein [Vibrio parahaemolyticus]